jgi:hypothetical protein
MGILHAKLQFRILHEGTRMELAMPIADEKKAAPKDRCSSAGICFPKRMILLADVKSAPGKRGS